MRKILVILFFIIIPVFAYEVYNPDNFTYREDGDKLLFVVDFSNSMGEYLEHKTKVNQVREMMNFILPQIVTTFISSILLSLFYMLIF